MTEGQLSIRVRIHGRVQGVWYRGWASDEAQALGLPGWARNRSDDTVEAVFSGSADKVRTMVERCREGPPAARVDHIDESSETEAVAPGIRVLPTL